MGCCTSCTKRGSVAIKENTQKPNTKNSNQEEKDEEEPEYLNPKGEFYGIKVISPIVDTSNNNNNNTSERRMSTHVDPDQINHIVEMLKNQQNNDDDQNLANKDDNKENERELSHIDIYNKTFGVKSREEVLTASSSQFHTQSNSIDSNILSDTGSLSTLDLNDNNNIKQNKKRNSLSTGTTGSYTNSQDEEIIKKKKLKKKSKISKKKLIRSSFVDREPSLTLSLSRKSVILAPSATPMVTMEDIDLESDTPKVVYHNRISYEAGAIQDSLSDNDTFLSIKSQEVLSNNTIDKMIDPRLINLPIEINTTPKNNSDNNNNKKINLAAYEKRIKSQSNYLNLALNHLDSPIL